MSRARWSARFTALALAVVAAAPAVGFAQTERSRRAEPPIQEIIRRFADAESQLRDARNQFMFKQDVTIQTLMGIAGVGGGNPPVTGTYRRVSEILFTDEGKRSERITFMPASTLRAITVTQEDLRDLGVIQPFALTSDKLPYYNVRYVGRESIDELGTYVFDVAPKDPQRMAKTGERYFTGRIWVEDVDFMIVKVAGKAGPELKGQRFPRFETYREHIDGKYWFPTYTFADDVLAFETGDVRVRMVVKYDDYRQFTGNITIIDDGEEVEPEEPQEPQEPQPER